MTKAHVEYLEKSLYCAPKLCIDKVWIEMVISKPYWKNIDPVFLNKLLLIHCYSLSNIMASLFE